MRHPSRIFNEPEDLLKAWNEYKEDRVEEAKKYPKVQYVGREGKRVEDYTILPLTLSGFKVFCHLKYGTVQHYFDNTDNYYDDFCAICSHIRDQIKENQITGGMLGIYNASITQRLNGLTDKQEVKVEDKVTEITVNVVKNKKK